MLKLFSRIAALAAMLGLCAAMPARATTPAAYGFINKVMVIELENESFSTTFGATSRRRI